MVFQSAILFAMPWSIGAVIDTDGREKFDQFYRQLLLGQFEHHPLPASVHSGEILHFPASGLIYDYYYSVSFVVMTYWLLYPEYNWANNLSSMMIIA